MVRYLELPIKGVVAVTLGDMQNQLTDIEVPCEHYIACILKKGSEADEHRVGTHLQILQSQTQRHEAGKKGSLRQLESRFRLGGYALHLISQPGRV